mgnify:FL=1
MEMHNLNIISPKDHIDFENYFNLRWEILRKPLGGSLSSVKDNLEHESYHLMVLLETKIIGVGRLHHLDSNWCQIRYMGVLNTYRGREVGTELLKKIENYAENNNKKYILLHARESALNFYIKNQYIFIEKSHLLLGKIQHYLMIKELN